MYALGTVRLAIDACDQAPDMVDVALRDARRVAEEYGSRYIREYASAATAAARRHLRGPGDRGRDRHPAREGQHAGDAPACS